MHLQTVSTCHICDQWKQQLNIRKRHVKYEKQVLNDVTVILQLLKNLCPNQNLIRQFLFLLHQLYTKKSLEEN